MRPEVGGRHDINIAVAGGLMSGRSSTFPYYIRYPKVEDHYINIMPAMAVSIKTT